MNKLFKYLKPYTKSVLLAPLLMTIEVITDLFQPALMLSIVDKGIPAGDIKFIIVVGLKMIGLAIIGLFGGFGCVYESSIAGMNFGTDLRNELYKKIQSFSFANLNKFKTSSLITRLTNDIVQIQMLIMMMLRVLVRFPLLTIGGIIMTIRINPELATILLVAIPALSIILFFIIKKGFPYFTKVQLKLDRVNSVMQENLSGIRVVKAYAAQNKEKDRFFQANKELRDTNVSAFRIVSLIMPVMMLIMNFSVIAVIWFGGIKVYNHEMKVGQIIAFISYFTQILFSLLMVAFVLMMLSRAEASAERINEVLETNVDITNKINPVRSIHINGFIKFENVYFSYNGSNVLCDININAGPGKVTAILGATGSGKSTLVSLIPRLYDPTKGRVLIDGIDIKDYEIIFLRESIGFVLQDIILFSGTIKENLLWGKENASEEDIYEACKIAEAHNFIISLPDGYNTLIGQKGVNLSGGQKQRIAIARTILKKPKILILDDSTSSIDMITESKIQKNLINTLKNTTCFIIAQRISSVIEADNIIVLDDGEIKGSGTHKELIKDNKIYQDIFESQIREGADFDVG